MGSGEAVTPKTEKQSSSAQEQTGVHPYPDWAAMQAYYGPGIAMSPYFGTTVTSGHAPHPYMWGPQPLMPPFGAPYTAIYPHGGVYAHPSAPLGSHAVVTSTASEAATTTQETPVKSPSNKDRGLTKKLKGPDGLAVSVGNGKNKNEAGGAAHAESQSTEMEGSSDGSNGNNNQTQVKRTLEDTAAGT
uniref:Common plant regulatory factor 1 n=1 Tax=Anthurium amnicola TaxID=1678845 RepID=A0A1D1ZDX4_9ARAE